MLNIQSFLKENHGDYLLLTQPPYNLKIKEKKDLILFNYSTTKSDSSNKIVKEARGLILQKNTWNIVRYGFNRFFNIGEKDCDSIDWDSSTSSIKHDGTLFFLYNYDDEWHIGTRGTFDADEAPLNNQGIDNFLDLFNILIKSYPNFDFNKLNPNYTYCLEGCSEFNKIVISYSEPKLFHILTRDNRTLKELDIDIGIPKPHVYICENEEDYRNLVNSFDESHEGIVIKDSHNRRAKIKSPLYFELHRMISNHNITMEYALDKIISGEDSEVLTYFPELRDYFKKVKQKYNIAVLKVEKATAYAEFWKTCYSYKTRKDYALAIKEMQPQALYFKAFENKAEEWFNELEIRQLIKIFNLEREIE